MMSDPEYILEDLHVEPGQHHQQNRPQEFASVIAEFLAQQPEVAAILAKAGRDHPEIYASTPATREVFERFFARNTWRWQRDTALHGDAIEDLLPGWTPQNNPSLLLCDRCLDIDLSATPAPPQDTENTCALCQAISMFLRSTERERYGFSFLDYLLELQPGIRICAIHAHNQTRSDPIPPGLPIPLESGSSHHFDLINAWVRLCDSGGCSERGSCCPDMAVNGMPTRVIDVTRYTDDLYTVRLIDSKQIPEKSHYVALSHCWGILSTDQKERWCTTGENRAERSKGFRVEAATFQDAIRVTRELGKSYLWIDSLCILQDSLEDWKDEAKTMKEVYRNAYCTIAASSAKDSTEGFLRRHTTGTYAIADTRSHGQIYISTAVDNLPRDVDNGVLNSRAWVLQERALSRRTIHFTKAQTYWECGGGVRCETLTYMTNEKASFLSDPEFPRSIDDRIHGSRIRLFQSLFAQYSALGITKKTDRPIAIDSLATALAEHLETRIEHGVFDCFRHRSLFWKRSREMEVEPLKRIPFTEDCLPAPPSWSWMAYDGEINFPDLGQSIEWSRTVAIQKDEPSNATEDSKTTRSVLKARIRSFRDDGISPNGPGFTHVTRDQHGAEVIQLWFDGEVKAQANFQCAVLGRQREKLSWLYCVLVVEKDSRRKSWERVGMGLVLEDRLTNEYEAGEIV